MKNKAIAAALMFAVLMILMCTTIFASGNELQIKCEDVTVDLSKGNTFEVDVVSLGDPAYICGTVDVVFDDDVFELSHIRFNEELAPNNATRLAEDEALGENMLPGSSEGVPVITRNGQFTVDFGDDLRTENYPETGVLFTMEFTVVKDDVSEEYSVELFGVDHSFLDKDGEYVDVTSEKGLISFENNNGENGSAVIRQASASFEGKIILNFYLLVDDDVLADNGAYVLFTGGSQNRKILVKDAAVKVVDGETRYCFTYPVVAKELRDNINLKIYDSNDRVIRLTNVAGTNDYTTSGVNYSLMTYCTKMLESSTSSAEMKALAQATIDYGTAAQIYFNYNAAGLSVDSRVTSVTLADLEQYKGVFSGTLPTGVSKRTLTALFEEDNSLRIYFTYDSGYTPDMYTYTIDGKSAPIHVKHGSNGDEYYLEVKGVQSNKLGKTHDLTISNGSTTYKITVSVLTYARSSVSNGTTDRQNLGKALYRYYLAAKAKYGE